MRSILMSVHPDWGREILNHRKTIEYRKTMPRYKFPMNVYIYVTKKPDLILCQSPFLKQKYNTVPKGADYLFSTDETILNGLVVAKFTINKAENIGRKYANQYKDSHFYDVLKAGCLTAEDLEKYSYVPLEKRKSDFPDLYAWYIENLIIFPEPKELSDLGLIRAPQSWCYVTVNDEN